MPEPPVSHYWKSHVGSHFEHIDLTNALVLLMMPSVSSDAKTGITWPKSDFAPYFNHFDLKNKMVPLAVLSVSCDAHTCAKGSTWPKEICLYIMKKIMSLMMQLELHDSNAGANGIIWLKKSGFISFWSLWSNECNGVIHNTTAIAKYV